MAESEEMEGWVDAGEGQSAPLHFDLTTADQEEATGVISSSLSLIHISEPTRPY